MMIFLTPGSQAELKSVQWRSPGSWRVVTALSPEDLALHFPGDLDLDTTEA